MITDERVVSFIQSLNKDDNELIRTIEQEALADEVPIVRPETKEFLKVLLLIKKRSSVAIHNIGQSNIILPALG